MSVECAIENVSKAVAIFKLHTHLTAEQDWAIHRVIYELQREVHPLSVLKVESLDRLEAKLDLVIERVMSRH